MDGGGGADAGPGLGVEEWARARLGAHTGNLAARLSTEHPERAAIVHLVGDGDDPDVLTYADVLAAVRGSAARWSALVAPGERVALLGANDPEWILAFLGLELVGAVPVPLSRKLPRAGLAHVIADSGSTRVVLGPSDAARAADLEALGVPVVPLPGWRDLVAEPGEPAVHAPSPQDLAMILYTSGSTGHPKGVPLTHASHSWVLDQVATARPEEFRVVVAAPLFHMNALARVQKAFASGDTVLLLQDYAPALYARAIGDHGAHELSGVPPMFALLAEHAERLDPSRRESVVHVNMASAPAGAALHADMQRLFPRARVTLGYGTTESGPVGFHFPDGVDVPVGSIGVAHPAVDVRLVDPVTHEPSGDVGTLQIRTGALFHGYLGVPTTTLTDDGYYHSKDLVRRENGFYVVVGREDSVFSCGGENIYPSTVETVLLAHPAVQEAAVVPVPDDVKGAKPVAFVTLEPGANADEQELRAFSLEHLEPNSHPRRVWVIEEMPWTGPHKIDVTTLEARARDLVARA